MPAPTRHGARGGAARRRRAGVGVLDQTLHAKLLARGGDARVPSAPDRRLLAKLLTRRGDAPIASAFDRTPLMGARFARPGVAARAAARVTPLLDPPRGRAMLHMRCHDDAAVARLADAGDCVFFNMLKRERRTEWVQN